MKYKIVPINETLIPGYCKAFDSVARERKYLAFLEGPSLEMSRAFVQRNLQKNYPHFVAIVNDQVIGWCDISAVDLLNRPIYSHSGSLGIGVLANYRGQGVGKALISAALDKAKSIGLTRVQLTVREHNENAIALYKKIGFVVEGVQINAMKIDDHYSNIICMAIVWS